MNSQKSTPNDFLIKLREFSFKKMREMVDILFGHSVWSLPGIVMHDN